MFSAALELSGNPTALSPSQSPPPRELRDEGVRGFRAAVDARGRVVVPASIRDSMDLDRGDTVEILIRRGDADG